MGLGCKRSIAVPRLSVVMSEVMQHVRVYTHTHTHTHTHTLSFQGKAVKPPELMALPKL